MDPLNTLQAVDSNSLQNTPTKPIFGDSSEGSPFKVSKEWIMVGRIYLARAQLSRLRFCNLNADESFNSKLKEQRNKGFMVVQNRQKLT